MKYTKLRKVSRGEDNPYKDNFYSVELDHSELQMLVKYLMWTKSTADSETAIGNIKMVVPGPWSHEHNKKEFSNMVGFFEDVIDTWGKKPDETVEE